MGVTQVIRQELGGWQSDVSQKGREWSMGWGMRGEGVGQRGSEGCTKGAVRGWDS